MLDDKHSRHFANATAAKRMIASRNQVISMDESSFMTMFFSVFVLEPSACLDSAWPLRTIKYSQKFQRICYIRITEVLRYHQAEQLCSNYGLQLAVIDNLSLLERLKEVDMCNE